MAQIVMNTYSFLSKTFTWGTAIVYGTTFVFSWVVYRIVLHPYITPLKKIPARKRANLIFGNMQEIFKAQSIDPYTNWIRDMKTGVIRYAYVFGEQRIMVADATAMKHILVTNSKNYDKPAFIFKYFLRVTGKGLLSLNGEEHLAQRNLCIGAFKSSFLRNMIPAMQRHSEMLVDIWAVKAKDDVGTDLDVIADLSKATLDIISECGFGYDTNALLNPDQPVNKAFFYLLGGQFGRSWLRMVFPILSSYLPLEENRTFAKNLKLTRLLIENVINNKQMLLNESTNEGKVSDLLSMMMMARDLKSGDGLTKQQMKDHVMTFMLAGHETTATTMTWALLKLSQNPDIQKRLRDEVTAVLPTRGQPITMEHLDQMKYLACVIKETLRLYPAAPNTFRSARNDDTINGYHIPAGTTINIHVGALHRNPAYWEDPDEFQPERFMDDSKIHPYSFLPFVAGPRMCIGYKFALMEMKVTLAILLRDLDFSLADPDLEYRKRQVITMRPEPDLKLRAGVVNA